MIDWRGDVEKGKKRKNGQLNVWISGDQVDLWTSDKWEASPLPTLRGITLGLRYLDKELRDTVDAARRRGHSWQEIADAIGVSRQAAWERFGSNEAEDDPISTAIGLLAGSGGPTSEEIRAHEREADAELEVRRYGRST